MRRKITAMLTFVALAAASLVVAGPASADGTVTSKGRSIGKWQYLLPGQELRSSNGRYEALLRRRDGRLVVYDGGHDGGHITWITPGYGTNARVFVHADGNVTVKDGQGLLWSANTSGAGPDARLVMRDNGSLVVERPKGVAWSSRFGNRCRSYQSGKKIIVDLSEQFMWECAADQEQMTSSITSGAVDRGAGTPTGTWQVQGHQRDRYLYPASGGAYFVHYWMPYDYDYGFP